jgi:DNA invertase Pin-like site-specific DNA recombinase
MQRDAIRKAAEARGDTIAHWYAEKRSAKTTARPELEKLRRVVREGGTQKLYVWKLDRLARSGIRDMLTIVEELREHGCTLVSLTDGFDLYGPASEVVLAVIAWAAKMELLVIQERLAAARELARERGTRWGRPPRMTAADVDKALALIRKGHSLRYIAQRMKVPRPTLARALSRKSPRKGLAKTSAKRGGLQGVDR